MTDETNEAAGVENGGNLGGDTVITYSIDTGGIERRQDELMEFLSEWREETAHPALITPFSDYTVSEALLLLLFLSVFFSWLVKLFKRGLAWLL